MLGRKTVIGSITTVAARITARLLDLATMLVLARILQPTDFGIVAIAMSLVAIVQAVLEMPLNQALLRLPEISRAQCDTAFTLSTLRGLVLALVLVLAAWPFSWFYGDDRLTLLVFVLSLSPIARGLLSPRLVQYQKQMSFWRDFVIELSSKCISFIVALGSAVLTASYWSIAAGYVTFSVSMVVASYILAPYRPRFSLAEFRVFFGFIGWNSAAQIFNAINWQSERLMLGKIKTNAEVGLFSAANDLASIPLLALFAPIQNPLLAAFSQFSHDKERLAKSYQTTACAIIAVGLPLLVGQSMLAEPSVRLVLGAKWLDAVPLLQWLPLSFIPGLFTLPAIPLLMSLSKTKVFFWRNLVEFGVKAPLLVVGAISFGFGGVIVARTISEIAADVFSAFVVRRLLGLTLREQLLVSWRSILSTLLMVPVVLVCTTHMRFDGSLVETVINLIAAVVAGAVAYGASSWMVWTLAGRPAGIEAMAMGMLTELIYRRRRYIS